MRLVLFGAGGMLATALKNFFTQEDLIEIRQTDCDITNAEAVARVVETRQPDVIMNAAAFTDVDGCEKKSDLAMAVNGTAVGTIAAAAKKAGAVVVHFSTDYVFDGQKKEGYSEADRPNPVSVYGRSKALGERLLLASGAQAYLIRTAWLYGVGGKNFVETMLRLADEKRSVNVVDDQVGSPTFTNDLADSIRDLLHERPPFGIYHRTNDGVVSWYNFTKEIYRQAGKATAVRAVTTAEFPRPARRPAVSTLRTTKLPPLRPWTEALNNYLHLAQIV